MWRPTASKFLPQRTQSCWESLMTACTSSLHIRPQLPQNSCAAKEILNMIAGSTWGKDKESLLAIYKAIGRSGVNYAAPIWAPWASETQLKKLLAFQNTTLRTATRTLRISPETVCTVKHLCYDLRTIMLCRTSNYWDATTGSTPTSIY